MSSVEPLGQDAHFRGLLIVSKSKRTRSVGDELMKYFNANTRDLNTKGVFASR